VLDTDVEKMTQMEQHPFCSESVSEDSMRFKNGERRTLCFTSVTLVDLGMTSETADYTRKTCVELALVYLFVVTQHEVRMHRLLQHKNILSALGCFTHGMEVWMVMPLMSYGLYEHRFLLSYVESLSLS